MDSNDQHSNTHTHPPPGPVRLRPRARIMRTIGDELISSEVVALVELVKNSYDADANNVVISFSAPLEEGQGVVEVFDDGHGMSLEVVLGVWLEPATPHKTYQTDRRSPRYKRRLLGEKGIGRFAAARIGDHLYLRTRRSGQQEVQLMLDWSQFEDDTTYLDEIEVLWETSDPDEISTDGALGNALLEVTGIPVEVDSGTVMRIENMRKRWDTTSMTHLRHHLARMISPFAIRSTTNRPTNEFNVFLRFDESMVAFSDLSGRIDPPELLQQPHYQIAGSVASNGSYSGYIHINNRWARENSTSTTTAIGGHFEMLTSLSAGKRKRVAQSIPSGDSTPPDGKRSPSRRTLSLFENRPSCGAFEFDLRIWDRDRDGLQDLKRVFGYRTLKEVRNELDSMAGISIYRDGFRVLPYGEPDNDWLRLDIRRVKKPTMRVSNNQILGVVSITGDENPALSDQSNREGIAQSQEFEDLQETVKALLLMIELERYDARPRNSKDTKQTQSDTLWSHFDTSSLRDYVKQAHPNDVKLKGMVSALSNEIEEGVGQVRKVIARYRSLATLGQLVDIVLHDGRPPLGAVSNEAFLSKALVGRLLSKNMHADRGDLERLHRRSDKILDHHKTISNVFSRIEPYGGKASSRPKNTTVEEAIQIAIDVYRTEIAANSVEVTVSRGHTPIKARPSDLIEIFNNLLSNSLYWLQTESSETRKVLFDVQSSPGEPIRIIASDSGPGIDHKHHNVIFDPYWSSREEGVGLGLNITGEIIRDSFEGELNLLEDGPLSGATFEIVLKKVG